MPRFLPLLALVVPAVALTACGTKTINESSMKSLTEKGLKAAQPPLTAKSIDCDSGVEAKVGKTGQCRAKLPDGRTVVYTLKVDKVSGDNGHMTIVGAKLQK